MTREPKIPMAPEQLPQQRIHEVITLPERPAVFDCVVGQRIYPKGALPQKPSPNATYLCQVEWAWSPAHTTGLMPIIFTEDEHIGLSGANTGTTTT